MIDFITFKRFISIEVLILFYYMGAVILPISAWFFVTWLIKKYDLLHVAYEKGKATLWNALNTRQKSKLIAFFIFAFIFMELFWRMLFEFLIAYLQIRDALLAS
jgi:hypothetical protein